MLGLFRGRGKKKSAGWICIAPEQARAQLACVERAEPQDQPPKVRWVSTEAWSDPLQTLRALRGSRQLQRWPLMALMERGQYQLTQLEAPNSPREEWRQASRWQLQELVDFPVDSAAIDVLEVPGNAVSGRRPHLLAAVAARDAVLPLLNASTEARLTLDVLDVAETALRNISALLEVDTGSLYRMSGYGFNASYPAACPATTGGQLMVDKLVDCNFLYSPTQGATEQYGFVAMQLTLMINNERATLSSGAHVLNVP